MHRSAPGRTKKFIRYVRAQSGEKARNKEANIIKSLDSCQESQDKQNKKKTGLKCSGLFLRTGFVG